MLNLRIKEIEILKTKFRYSEQEAVKFFEDIQVDESFEDDDSGF